MRRVSRYNASRQTVAYKRESLGDAQYHKPPTSSERPPGMLHVAARRPLSRIPIVAARRPARHTSPQHGVARNCHQSPDYAINPRRARVCANSQPSLFTIACTPATYRPLTYCTEAPH